MNTTKRPLLAPAIALALALILSGLAPAFAQDDALTPAAESGDAAVAALHRGDCAEPEAAPVAELGVLSPFGEGQDAAAYVGAHTGVPAVWSANVTLDVPFDDVFGAQPHVIAIHESAAAFGTLLACGEAAGAEVNGRVISGIHPVNDSGMAGVAIFDDDDAGFLGLGEEQTQIAIYIVPDLTMAQPAEPDAALQQDEAAATPAPVEEDAAPAEEAAATPVAAPEDEAAQEAANDPAMEDQAAVEAVTVEAIDIDFVPSEFSIPANTDVPVMLVNTGEIQHTFTIDELGIDEVLDPGEEREITINADPGEYVYYCTVPGHRPAGQEGVMTVE